MSKVRNQKLIWGLILLIAVISMGMLVEQGQAAEKKITVPIKISLPEEAGIKAGDLMVLTFLNKVFLTSSQVKVSILVNTYQPIMVNNQDGEIIMMGYVFGGELARPAAKIRELKKYSALVKSPIEINSQSTALSLTMMNLALGSAKPKKRLKFAQKVLAHNKFPVLVNEVKTHLIERPDKPLIKQNNVRQLTGSIIQDVYQQLQ